MKKNKLVSCVSVISAAVMLSGCTAIAERSPEFYASPLSAECLTGEAASNDSEEFMKLEKGEADISKLKDSGFYVIRGGGFVHSEYLSDSGKAPQTTVSEPYEPTDTDSKSDTSGSGSSPSSTAKYTERYAYNTLNETEKGLYASIVKAAENFETSVTIPDGMTSLGAFKIFIMVFNEEPQLFWMDSNFSTAGDSLIIGYKANKSQIKSMQAEIDANVSPLLAKINGASSDYEKLKLMYDYIVLHNDFSLDSAGFNPSIYNAFTDNGQLQCAGYAKAVQYLCDKAGMESTVIVGQNSSGESHAWNVVKCGGKFYNLDSTWGDPMDPSSGKIDYKSDYIRYTYFLVPDSIIHNISHCKVNEYETSMGTVKCFTPPSCTSEDYNYFRQKGLYYTDKDEAKNAVKSQIKKAVANEFQAVQVRVSSEEIFNSLTENSSILEFQKYAKSLSNSVSKILVYKTETYKKTGIVTIDIVYK